MRYAAVLFGQKKRGRGCILYVGLHLSPPSLVCFNLVFERLKSYKSVFFLFDCAR
ncbi:hypothetical protein PORCRE_1932 [Porphyromonas crevioricanis JCM 15906]|uniref:Uncharacterized protein n=1 Tax=Porphyromonas crevioricanis JCM 15906 TaxID=1305617 RepID=T1CSQ3_9PORP|nr:hypothetical protein PORCRE_1932 [Porphyromonas crevioricanis JCM 15906]